MKSTKKFLSLLLSVVMVFTVFNVAFVSLAPEVYAAPTAADYDALADAIRQSQKGAPGREERIQRSQDYIKRFDGKDVAGQVFQLYQQLL